MDDVIIKELRHFQFVFHFFTLRTNWGAFFNYFVGVGYYDVTLKLGIIIKASNKKEPKNHALNYKGKNRHFLGNWLINYDQIINP